MLGAVLARVSAIDIERSILRVLLAIFLVAGGGCRSPLGEAQTQPLAHGAFGGLGAIEEQARLLASQPYAMPEPSLPAALARQGGERLQHLPFARRHALWRSNSSRWIVELYPRSTQFPRRVAIYNVRNSQIEPILFTKEMFDFGKDPELERAVPADLGFAGFRLLYPLNRPDRFDEVVSFLGGTYFRAVGRNQAYGTSARGLAIDTGLPVQEEFPFFQEFWLEQPEPTAAKVAVYALMNSPRATGAYRFDIVPGEATRIEVQAQIYMRRRVPQLGLAPLTSMFLAGVDAPAQADGEEPLAVHDADGLLLAGGVDEWLWRPLRNPRRSATSSFPLDTLRGFGLLQRDRDPAHYPSSPLRYQDRPSVWFEPLQGAWGGGQVLLLEMTSDTPDYDNVNAFWKPAAAPQPGRPLELRYLLTFSLHGPEQQGYGKVVATRIEPLARRAARFSVSFAGGPLEQLHDRAPVQPVVSASAGTVDGVTVQRSLACRCWELRFTFLPEPGRSLPAELRASLKGEGGTLSEIWSFPWP